MIIQIAASDRLNSQGYPAVYGLGADGGLWELIREWSAETGEDRLVWRKICDSPAASSEPQAAACGRPEPPTEPRPQGRGPEAPAEGQDPTEPAQ